MLVLAGLILGLALAFGAWIAIDQMRQAAAPKLALALIHGALALIGLVLLLLALGGPERGAAAGAASFGKVAAILLSLAIIPGTMLFITHLRRKRLSGVLIAFHAFLAISGCVILLTYILLA
jgi:hypothetical protein